MRSISIKPVSEFARKLEAEGFENRGAYSGDNGLYDFERGGECIGAGDIAGLKRLRRLSPKRWAKWFFTDSAGNLALICAAPWDR